MKQIILILAILLCFGSNVWSQNMAPEVQATIDACMALRAAIGAGSNEGLKQANKALANCNVQPFNKLRCSDKDTPSLKGHFIFEEEFVDSLITNRKVYKFAQQYADRSAQRTTSSSGKVYAKTCLVLKKKSTTYTLTAKGTQYIAVVTEPKGLVTLRIYDKTNDEWYNDTEDVYLGRPLRVQTLDLPKDKNSLLEIEIINNSKKNISFVIIGN